MTQACAIDPRGRMTNSTHPRVPGLNPGNSANGRYFSDRVHTKKAVLQEVCYLSLDEKIAIWEDELDALGGNLCDEDLHRMVDMAPCKTHHLYSFALGVLIQRTQKQWSDSLHVAQGAPSSRKNEEEVSSADSRWSISQVGPGPGCPP